MISWLSVPLETGSRLKDYHRMGEADIFGADDRVERSMGDHPAEGDGAEVADILGRVG